MRRNLSACSGRMPPFDPKRKKRSSPYVLEAPDHPASVTLSVTLIKTPNVQIERLAKRRREATLLDSPLQ